MRIYTEEEARTLLPQVKPVLTSLREAFVGLRALRTRVSAETRGAATDGSLLADPWSEGESENHAEELALQLREATQRLAGWGIELKDPARGLIDFYHERDGAVVYLCYLLGEDDITYWHTLAGGFAGRRPL